MAINFKEITIATNDATNKCILGVWFEDGPPTVYPFVSIPSRGDAFRYGTSIFEDLGDGNGSVIGHCIGPHADIFRRRSTPTTEWVDRVAIDDPENWVITDSGRTVIAVYQGETVPVEARSVAYNNSTTVFSCHMEHVRYLQLDDVLAEGTYTVTNTMSGYSRQFVYSDRTTRCCGLRVDQGWIRPDDPNKQARLSHLIYGGPNSGVITYPHTEFEIINPAGTACFSGEINEVINENDPEDGVTYCYADVAPAGKKTATAWDQHSRKITCAEHGFSSGDIVITHGWSNGVATVDLTNIGALWNGYIRVADATADDFRIGSGSFTTMGGVFTALLDSIAFGANFVADNSISGTINGNAWGPVVFSTNQATAMAQICDAIEAALPGVVAEISTEIMSGGVNSTYHPAINRVIEVRNTNSVNLTLTCSVTGGASQPTVTLRHPTFGNWAPGLFDDKHDSKIYPANVRNRWGTKVYKIDYSAATAADFPDNEYRVRIPGLGVSFPTVIDMAGHAAMLKLLVQGRLGQVTGIELDGTHAPGGVYGHQRGVNYNDGVNDQKVFWSAMPCAGVGRESLDVVGSGVDTYQAGVGRHLVFTGTFVTGNVINGKVGGVPFGPINFTTNGGTTWTLIVNAVIAAVATVSGNYYAYADPQRAPQAIWVVPRPRADFAFPPEFTELSVTGGASQPVPSAPVPWYTEVRALGFKSAQRDAGDHDYIGLPHIYGISFVGLWGYDSLPANARAFDFGIPKVHEVYTGSIYNSGNWLSSVIDLVLFSLESLRITQRADGGVSSGTLINSAENSGLGATAPAFEPTAITHSMMALHAAEPLSTMGYACCALQMSKRYRALGHTAPADAWYDSGIAAYDWAESMYQSWLGDDTVIDAYFIGELGITSRDECPNYTALKAFYFQHILWPDIRRAASAVRYSIDGGATYELIARGLGGSDDAWKAITLWEYVHATGQTPARDAATLTSYQGFLSIRDSEATAYLSPSLAYPTPGATGALSNDKYSTLHSWVYGGHEDVLKMLLSLKLMKCGLNGLNKSYVTRLGTHYIKDPLQTDFSMPLLPPGFPPPGIPVYGITSGDILGNNGLGCNTTDGPVNSFASVSTGHYDANDGFRKVIEPPRVARPFGAQSLNCSLNIFEREFSISQLFDPFISMVANFHARDGNTKMELGPNYFRLSET